MPQAKAWHFRIYFFKIVDSPAQQKASKKLSGAKEVSGLQPQGPPDWGPGKR